MAQINDHLVLICGESVGGKSASLRDLEDPEGVLYQNLESGKKLPFKSQFKEVVITDPLQVYTYFNVAEDPKNSKCHTIVVDSITYMMEMFYSVHVHNAKDTMKGWLQYQQFFKNLMQQYVARSTKNVIMTAHTLSILNESEHVMEKKVPVQGALKNTGIESYFSVIVAAKKIPISMLEPYENDLLVITDEEKDIGIKHVFQTRLTKETVNERIRAPMGMWEKKETFIDNNTQLLMNRLREFYQ